MNLGIIFLIFLVVIGLTRLKLPMIVWALVSLAAVYALIRFGISPAVPSSVVMLYMNLALLGVLSYVLADEERMNEVKQQAQAFMVEDRFKPWLALVVIALPLLVATNIYFDMTRQIKAPTFGRTIHPAPPSSISFKGKEINLTTAENPYRELETSNPEEFKAHVANGKVVYYQNCVYCHGDALGGDGIFAHGYNPVPANFNSATAIAMLQESYLFWRIAKGAPGLPDESGPWSSSMPAWEDFLSEEEIWDVILFLYDQTGFKPRAREEHH